MKKSLGAKRIEAFLLTVMLCIMCIWGNNAVASAESDAELTVAAQENYSEDYAVAEDSAIADTVAGDVITEDVFITDDVTVENDADAGENADASDVIVDSEVVGAGTYTITYDLDGGTNDPRNPSTYTTNGNVYLYNPTKEGYTFARWESSENMRIRQYGDDAWYFAGAVAKDITLKAKWTVATVNYTIYFDGNGATSGSMEPIKSTGTSNTISIPECKFKKEGFVFDGWIDGPNSSVIKSNSYTFKPMTYSVTLKAVWRQSSGFYVSFETRTHEMEIVHCTDNMLDDRLPDPPEEEGYRFLGWSATSDGTNYVVKYRELVSYANGAYVTAYGIWQRKSPVDSVYYNFTLDQELYYSVLFQTEEIPVGMYYVLGARTYYVTSDDVDEYTFEKIQYKRLKIKVKPTQITLPVTLYDPSGGEDGKYWTLGFEQAYRDYDKPIVNAILDYCAYTRLYYGDDMGTNTVPDFEQTISRVSAVKAEDLANYEYYIESYDENIEYLGSSLLSENRIGIRHYFKIQDTSVARGSAALIDGEAVTLIPAGGNIYYIQLDGIAAAEFSDMNTISIGNLTLNYAVYSYIKGALEVENCGAYLQSLCKAIYLYGEAARKLQA